MDRTTTLIAGPHDNSQASTQPASTFHRFADLPTELRLIIWAYAVETRPAIHFVRHGDWALEPSQPGEFVFDGVSSDTTDTVHANGNLLAACPESRREVVRAFSGHSRNPATSANTADLENDVYCFDLRSREGGEKHGDWIGQLHDTLILCAEHLDDLGLLIRRLGMRVSKRCQHHPDAVTDVVWRPEPPAKRQHRRRIIKTLAKCLQAIYTTTDDSRLYPDVPGCALAGLVESLLVGADRPNTFHGSRNAVFREVDIPWWQEDDDDWPHYSAALLADPAHIYWHYDCQNLLDIRDPELPLRPMEGHPVKLKMLWHPADTEA